MFAIDKTVEQYKKVFATQFISKYDLIMENDALIMATEVEVRKYFCQYCQKQSQKALSKCSKCVGVFYCSANCQKNDWAIHKLECPVFVQLNEKKYKISALLLLTLRVYIKSKYDQTLKQIVDDFYTNIERFSKEKARNIKNIGYVLLKFLNEETDTKNKDKMVSLVARIQQNYVDMGNQQYGIFSPFNYINHACNPNAVLVLLAKKVQIGTFKNLILI